MRTCEHGACIKPAVYRGPRDERGAAAWCEDHVPKVGTAYTLGPNPLPLYPLILAPGVVPIPGAQQEVKP